MTSASPRAAAPSTALTHRQIRTILFGLMMGMFLAALDQTVVSTSIRTIADDLNGLNHQAWATTAYLITATISTPLYGKLSDIYGRRLFFSVAITIFVVGSALCSLSQDMTQLAAFRALQGLGAGGLFSLALAILGDIVPPRERAKYQGYFLAVFGTSSVLGPVIGGFFAGADDILMITGWRWVFLVNVPIGLAAFVVVQRTLKMKHTRLDHRLDWWGAASLAMGLVPLLVVAEQGREWGWGSPEALTCYVIGVASLTTFFFVEKRMGVEALLPLSLFSNRTVRISSIASVMLGVAMFGGLATLPLYLQIVKGATPTEAGLMLLPMTLGIMTGSILSGQVIARTGRYRIFPIIGSATLTLAMVAMSFVGADTALPLTMTIMAFFGFGLGSNMQPLTLAVQNAVSPRMIGVATASATFTRQMGGTIGTAVFLSLLFAQAPLKIGESMQQLAPTAAFQSALQDPANADFAGQFQQATASGADPATAFGGVLQDSSSLTTMDPALARPFLVGFSESMDLVFLVSAGVMAICFLVLLRLPEIELRSGSAYSERADEDAADAARAAAVAAPTSSAPLDTSAGDGPLAEPERDKTKPRISDADPSPAPQR
ncbi:MAG: MDR family MFS transporter [Ornithinimicrobium sp.]